MATTFTGSELASKAVCTTDTEAANQLTASAGLNLAAGAIKGISVMVTAHDGASNLTAGGILQAYTYEPQTASWNRANELDLTIAAAQVSQAFPAQSVSSIGRVAYLPSGAGQPCDIYINGSRRGI